MRLNVKKLGYVLVAGATALLAVQAASARDLVTEGKSAYQIVLSPTASPSEHTAAKELQYYLKACTGAELPVTSVSPPDGTPTIVLGCGPAAASLGVQPDPADLGEQGYLIRTAGPHLVIAGTAAVGTLYGVYDFLEDSLGVRWYAPGTTRTTTTATVAVPDIDRLVTPAFPSRHTGFPWSGDGGPYRPYVRDNGGSGGPDDPHGVQYAFDGTCHTYFSYIRPEGYFDTHPEYFSEIGGRRCKEDTQLCLTNPEVLDIVTEKVLARMAARPNDRQHNFSQMDWYNYCECDRCAAVNERYGSLGATQFWFVNQLAERTSKVYPDKLIGTLAYTYTEEPPAGMEIHPNVAVWLCHMFPSCDSHPIATCPRDAEYKRRALAWASLCKHLYIWHYTVDYAHYFAPFPNFRALAADLKFYRDIGVEGMYLQSGAKGGDFNLLHPYYYMKLAWNPDQDADALLQDFLQGYYGAAWEPLWDYITALHDKVQNEDVHMHLYTNPAQGFLPDGLLRHADVLFDRAESAVGDDPELLERVRVARMAITYARLFPRNGYAIQDGKLTVQGDVASPQDAAAFLERMKAHGYNTIREWGGAPEQLNMWAAFVNNPVPVERIENGDLLVDVVPLFGGRALRIIHRGSAECVTAYNTAANLYFPFAGGEEARLGTLHDTPANSLTTYAVAEKTGSSITLEGQALGFALRRTLTLAPDRPVLMVKNEITNLQGGPVPLILRNHLELELGDLMKTAVSFTNRDGAPVARTMETIVAGLREGEAYRGQNAPNGAWTFRGSKGLQVTQTFDPDQTDFTWLTAYPTDLNELELEIWAKPVTLAPGETATFESAIEIGRAE